VSHPFPGIIFNLFNIHFAGFLLSPINPSDINVIEGVYPLRPNLISSLATSGKGSREQPVYIAGNEGLAKITEINDPGLKQGDWVVLAKPQSGTWSSCMNIPVRDLLLVPMGTTGLQLSEVQGATLTVSTNSTIAQF
jgi:NADPH:quinone reductase-like Zn-dependent oxidoreductase